MPTTKATSVPKNVYRAGPHPSPWQGPLAALDILLNNLGVGLFLIAAVGDLVAHDAFAGIVGIAIPLAFCIIALDLLLLVIDLGDPFRFFHMLRVIKLRTPMSVGVWSLSLLMTLLLPIVVISVVGWFTDVPSGLATIATILTAVAIVPALGAITYKGVLFSITAQPGWRDARWFGAYVCSSGPALGSSLLLLIAVLGDGADAVKTLATTTLALIVISIVAVGLLHRDLRPELLRRTSRARHATLVAGFVLAWLVIPVTVLLLGANALNCCVALASMLAADYAVRLVFVSIPSRT
jgi:hypothetical protein